MMKDLWDARMIADEDNNLRPRVVLSGPAAHMTFNNRKAAEAAAVGETANAEGAARTAGSYS